jgi:hypothetical protein
MYLDARQLINLTGKDKYIMHSLVYIRDDPMFKELTRIDQVLKKNAGHNRFFRGVCCIDICDWINNLNDSKFKVFLSYLESKRDKILPILYIHNENENIIREIESAFSSIIRFDTVRFRFPEIKELINLIDENYLKPNHYTLSTDAMKILIEKLDEIVKNKSFNGFITIEQIAKDLLFYLFRSKMNENEITETDLINFFNVSDFINRLSNPEYKKTIGFSNKLKVGE